MTKQMKIARLCRDLRMNILKCRLIDMEAVTGIQLKTLSSFEQGRSTNMTRIFSYVSMCDTPELKESFINSIATILGE